LFVAGDSPGPKASGWQNELALAHPDFAHENGRIEYITYFRATYPGWVGETRLVEITFR